MIDLFINLRDGNINPKKVLKIQINFKSDLGEIKQWNSKSKAENQISVMQDVYNFFDWSEKIIDILEIILSCYLKLNTRQNMKMVWK